MTHLELLISRYPVLEQCRSEIEKAFELLCKTYDRKKKVLTCGNGGSASDAMHIVGELMKSFVLHRDIKGAREKLFAILEDDDARYIAERLEGALPAVALQGEIALSTAFSNDVAPDLVYAQQVLGLGCEGDCLVGLSTSGNSPNVVRAVQTAKALGLHTIGMTSSRGGKLKECCDVCICVPETETFKVQELHLPVYHTLCLMLEERYFGRKD